MVAGPAHKKNLEIEKMTNILTSEANLQSRQTSMEDHFCTNSQGLKVVYYFCIKAPPQMFSWAQNMPLYFLSKFAYQKTCVSTKKMVAGLAHKKYFKKRQIVKKMHKQKTTYLPNITYLSNQI